MLAVLLLLGCTFFDGILTSNYEDYNDYSHSYYDYDDDDDDEENPEMFSVTEQARVRRNEHSTIKTLNPEELQDVKGALEQIMSGRNLYFITDTPSTNPVSATNGNDDLTPKMRNEYDNLTPKPQNEYDNRALKSRIKFDDPNLGVKIGYEGLASKYRNENEMTTKFLKQNDYQTPDMRIKILNPKQKNEYDITTKYQNKYNPTPTRIKYEILNSKPQNEYEIISKPQNEYDITTKSRNKYDNPTPTRIEYKILTSKPQNEYEMILKSRNGYDITTISRNKYDNPTLTRIEYEILTSKPQNEYEYDILTPIPLIRNENLKPTRVPNKEDQTPTRLRSKYSQNEYDNVTPTTVINEYETLTPNPSNDHLTPNPENELSEKLNNKIAKSEFSGLAYMGQIPTRAKSYSINTNENKEKEELVLFLSKMADDNYRLTTEMTPSEETIILRSNTSASNTKNKTIVRTSSEEKKFDVDKFLLIVANLTYDYYTNLTAHVKAKLDEIGAPTCGTPSTTEITTTLGLGPPDYSDMAKDSVRAKCFVCGLEERAIPYEAPCADAFAGDFIPLVPQDPRAKGQIARFRKYCRYDDVNNYMLNHTYPRSIFGRWTGGCAVRWTDLSGVYTQRTCRNRLHATTGRHYASKRMAKLEMALSSMDNGCIISPVATLLPLSRGISLFARFHACVCTGNWCNRAVQLDSDIWMTFFIALTAVFAPILSR